MNARRLPTIALLIGLLVLAATAVVGWAAFRTSRARLTRGMLAANEELARALAAHTLHGAKVDDREVLADLVAIWSAAEPSSRAFLCVVGPEGRVLVNTGSPESEGTDVSALTMRDPEGHELPLSALAHAPRPWSGFLELEETFHLVAVAPVAVRPDWLLFVHVPSSAVEEEIRAAVVPWLLATVLFGGLLMPVSLVAMHRAFTASRAGEQRAWAERELQKAYFERLFQDAPVGIVVLDVEDRVLDANREFQRIFGYDLGEAKGRPINSLIVPPERAEEASGYSHQVLSNEEVRAETIRMRKDGTKIWVGIVGSPIEVEDRQIGVYGLYKDVSERKRAEERLLHAARHDALTGLPNRTHFTEKVEAALARRREVGTEFTVLVLEILRFKGVVDSLGHRAGDEVLLEVAKRLSAQLRDGAELARVGGEEFAAILPGVDLARTREFAVELRDTLEESIRIDGQVVFVSATLGLVEGRSRYARAEDLLRDADTALEEGRGGEGISVFEPSMHSLAVARLDLDSALRQAVERGELTLHYQPIIELESGRLVGFEGLLRWLRPEVGLVAPGLFVPAAEETGLVSILGHWVLEEACRQLAEWRSKGPRMEAMQVSINLSARQLLAPDLVRDVREALERHRLPARALKLEVTETAVMGSFSLAREVLSALRTEGLEIHLDDFGIGHSSLSRLQALPVDVIKIDRSFLDAAEAGRYDVHRAIGTLAQGLGKVALAEGIESAEQLAGLRALGCCGLGQGFFFSRPVEASAAESLALSQPRW